MAENFRCRLSSTVMVGILYSSRFWMCAYLPRIRWGRPASVLHELRDDHGVSDLHDQNDWLIAYFAPYE